MHRMDVRTCSIRTEPLNCPQFLCSLSEHLVLQLQLKGATM